MQPFHAKSFHDLRRTLEQFPVPVPPRGNKGRTKEHTQPWVIRHFLVAIAESDLLEYPMDIEPGDRPDLVLSSPFRKTGIEITEAVPQDRAKVEALIVNKKITETVPEDRAEVGACPESDDLDDIAGPIDIPGTRFVPPYRYGEERSDEEIEDIARKRDRTRYLPHMGDSIERNWIEAMMCITKHKARKLALPGFAKHSRSWLLIYDNWSPAAHGCHNVAKPLAQQLFNCEWRNPFERILILRDGPTVWEFTRNSEIRKFHDSRHSN